MFQHAFVVPAYGYSEHLKDCIASLQAQTLESKVLVSTSTPEAEAEKVCRAAGVEYFVHSPNRGIGNDWNRALRMAKTKWVTVAHQDDLYYPEFAESVRALADSPGGEEGIVMAFSDYHEFTGAGLRRKSRLLHIKTMLLHLGFLGRGSIRDPFSKRNLLRFACPIPCPAVTLNTDLYSAGFDESFQVNLDWATWLAAADVPGAFAWIRRPLMAHRIHEHSETSAAIHDGRRAAEDLRILRRLWPEWMARKIAGRYKLAYTSNET